MTDIHLERAQRGETFFLREGPAEQQAEWAIAYRRLQRLVELSGARAE